MQLGFLIFFEDVLLLFKLKISMKKFFQCEIGEEHMSHFSNSCKPKEKNEICSSVSTHAVKCDGLFFVLQHGFQYGFQHA